MYIVAEVTGGQSKSMSRAMWMNCQRRRAISVWKDHLHDTKLYQGHLFSQTTYWLEMKRAAKIHNSFWNWNAQSVNIKAVFIKLKHWPGGEKRRFLEKERKRSSEKAETDNAGDT